MPITLLLKISLIVTIICIIATTCKEIISSYYTIKEIKSLSMAEKERTEATKQLNEKFDEYNKKRK